MHAKTLIAATLLAATAAAHAQSATYAVDPTHTFVFYESAHFGTSTNRGRFPIAEGKVTYDKAGKAASVDITIDIAGVTTGVAPLDTHLKSKDFFDAGANPTGRFVSEKVTFSGDKVAEVSGKLTLRGKTQPVTLKATNFNCYQNPMLKREVCGGDFTTTLVRSHYGITYGLNYGFPDNIRLLVQVEAVKQ
jgi:polyisoprenoid-binding protein YceI